MHSRAVAEERRFIRVARVLIFANAPNSRIPGFRPEPAAMAADRKGGRGRTGVRNERRRHGTAGQSPAVTSPRVEPAVIWLGSLPVWGAWQDGAKDRNAGIVIYRRDGRLERSAERGQRG